MESLVPLFDDVSPAPLWERRTGETEFEYAWFVRYAELGETRTMQDTSKRLGISVVTIRDAAKRWGWEERARAYDAQVIAITLAINPEESEALAVQYAAGMLMLRVGFDAMKLKNPALMKVKDIRELLQFGSEMVRRGAGVADLKIEHNVIDRVAENIDLLLGPEERVEL